MNTGLNKIIFHDLFMTLRDEVGIELDFSQYSIFIEALVNGYGRGDTISDEVYIKNLCKNLWLTNQKFESGFEYHFAFFMKKHKALFKAKNVNNQEAPPLPEKEAEEKKKDDPSSPITNKDQDTQPPKQEKQDDSKRNLRELIWDIGDHEGQQTTPRTNQSEEETFSSIDGFIFSDKQWPVSERKLQRYWRNLNTHSHKIPTDVINVEKTVDAIAKNDYIANIKFESKTLNKDHFIFLIDTGGSMIAFEELSKLLFKTFNKSLKPKNIDLFHFHDCPNDYLFEDPALTKGILVSTFFKKLDKKAIVFIISDAGAARGFNDDERITKTFNFIKQLKNHTQRLLWINPVPSTRWFGSSASYISLAIEMIEIGEESFETLPYTLKHL